MYPKEEKFETVAREGYKIMILLKSAGLGVEPKYVTVRKKEDAKLFEWSYEEFAKLLKKEEQAMKELGYVISFFSSLDEKSAAGITLCTGVSFKALNNHLDIRFPCEMNFNHTNVERIELLFKQCIKILRPYYGEIINNKNIDRFGTSMRKGKPTTVHWMNYYATPELLRILDKAEDEYTFYKKENFQDGCYFRIKDLPINDDSEEDVKLQSYINHLLGLQ